MTGFFSYSLYVVDHGIDLCSIDRIGKQPVGSSDRIEDEAGGVIMDEQKKENRYQLVKRVGHINTAVKLFKIAFESENYTIKYTEAHEV